MISIVVPAYNAGKFLTSTIQSVQDQTYPHWEMIVVDDGSKDDTFALACAHSKKDSRITALSQKNAGVSVARNHGFTATQPNYPYALFLDSDDMLVPDTLQTLLSALEQQPEAPAACGLVQEMDASGEALVTEAHFETILNRRGIAGNRLVRRDPASGISFGDLCFHNYITTPGTVLARKSAIGPPPVFDTRLTYTEDWDLWWRVTMQHGPIAVVPKTVLHYRIHSSNMSQNHAIARRGVFAFQRNLIRFPGMSQEQKRAARAGFFYHSLAYAEYAAQSFQKGEMKQGFRQAGLAVRDLLRFSQELLLHRHASQLPAAPGQPASEETFG